MRTVELGRTGLQVPSVVSGMMRIADKTDQQIRDLYKSAREIGINFFDHADIYGPSTHFCEARFGEALALSSSERDQILLQSKAGIITDGPYYDFSYDHIIQAVEGSLTALRTDHLDVLLLHRPDTLAQPEEVARAFDELHSAGKVIHFGVSNQTPGFIELLKTAVKQPLVANQLQLSAVHAPIVGQELAMNMEQQTQSVMLDGQVLSYSRVNGMTIQAWSPIQSGFFTGTFLDNPDFPALNQVLAELADQYSVTPLGIATSWITSHPAGMQVVLGTTNPSRLKQAAEGSHVVLTRPEWYRVFRAAGHIVP